MFSVLLTESPAALQALDLSAEDIASEIEKHRSIARLKVRACNEKRFSLSKLATYMHLLLS